MQGLEIELQSQLSMVRNKNASVQHPTDLPLYEQTFLRRCLVWGTGEGGGGRRCRRGKRAKGRGTGRGFIKRMKGEREIDKRVWELWRREGRARFLEDIKELEESSREC